MPKRRKQAGPHSGVGSLARVGTRWKVVGYARDADGAVTRPTLHTFPAFVRTATDAQRAFKKYCDSLAPAQVKDVAALCAAFLTVSSSRFDRATARQWSTMQGHVGLASLGGGHLREFRNAVDKNACKANTLNSCQRKNLSKGPAPKPNTHTREGVNRKAKAVLRILAWGVSAGMASPDTLAALKTVEPLRAGKAKTPDGKGRGPCSVAQYEAVLPFLAPPLSAALIVQRWTGARPDEVLGLRWGDVVWGEPNWIAKVAQHKTMAYGVVRILDLNRHAQAAIREISKEKLVTGAFIFRISRPRSIRKYLPRISEAYYRRAIADACREAGVPVFTPYQVRHMRLTEIEAALGREAASAVAAHTNALTTARYVKQAQEEKTRELSREGAMVGV